MRGIRGLGVQSLKGDDHRRIFRLLLKHHREVKDRLLGLRDHGRCRLRDRGGRDIRIGGCRLLRVLLRLRQRQVRRRGQQRREQQQQQRQRRRRVRE